VSEDRIARLETIVEQHEKRIAKIENELTHIRNDLDSLRDDVATLKADMNWVRSYIKGLFWTSLGTIISLIILLVKLFGG